ncbi:MAG: phosphomethylpyrimidine synthase ThiC [candidate division WOR-3 bacterium]
MTQRQKALAGIITPEMRQVATDEGLAPERVLELVRSGRVVILKNVVHDVRPIGVGEGLRTKVNANIGSSPYHMVVKEEIEKLHVAVDAGADTVMDLSLGQFLNRIRKEIIKHSRIPVGTVPIYQVGFELSRKQKRVEDMTLSDFLRVMEKQAREGVDFMTIHAGTTRRAWELMKAGGRVLNVVSRGGSMLVAWMEANGRENLLYEGFDEILDIAEEYDITLSLGDGMRPGAIADAGDRPQIEELITLAELGARCLERGVQVMIEGPGHVPLGQIETNIMIQKSLTRGLPFYILGPLPTDIAPGYDHIAAAVGGAIAGAAGADFLCYLTPAEHLRLPTPQDVREGVIITRIAAHIADLAKGFPVAWEHDRAMSEARARLDWETMFRLAIDPEKARRYRAESEASSEDFCTMCGEFCAVKALKRILGE